MTTPDAELRAEVANVKTALSSSACCNATLSCLQTLLGAGAKPIVNDTASKENVRPKPTKPARTTAARTKTKTNAAAASQVQRDEKNGLAPRDRVLLATEVVNISLKVLGDALKPQPRKHRISASISNQTNHARRSSAASITASPRPLMSRAVSQLSNASARTSSLRRSSSYSSMKLGPGPHIVATAECARLAFAYLRSLEAWNTSTKSLPALQLEHGMLALIGKLLAHGLDSLAAKELRILKKRLIVYMEQSKDVKEADPKATNGKKTAGDPEKETLANLLSFDDIDVKSPALQLIVNHQLHVLKIIANSRKPATVEAANEFLQQKTSSPLALLSEIAKKPTAKDKAARQLETLAQTLFSICPSLSSSSDSVACSGKIYASPETVLQLQRLAFECRVAWWKISGHAPDVSKELMEPFVKCLTAFSRRSQTSASATYRVAVESLEGIDQSIGSLSGSTKKSDCAAARSNVYRILSTLAQSAGKNEEALTWTEKFSSPSENSKSSEARSAASKVRIAALKLDQLDPEAFDEESAGVVESALESLRGSLKGDSSDLDLLLSEVSGMRKAATRPFTSARRAAGTPDDPAKRQLDSLSFSALCACVHFLARYMGTSPSEGSDAKLFLRHGERLVLASRIGKGFVDSAAFCCKVTILANNAEWDELDGLLQDCLFVLRELDIYYKAQARPVTSELPFVKLSGVYWLYYIQLRKTEPSDDALLQPLRRSIDIVVDREVQDQVSGLLLVKLEKLGETLEAMRRFADSQDAFIRSLKIQMSMKALDAVAERASKTPLNQLMNLEGPIATFTKTLRALHKLFLRNRGDDASERVFFDDKDLNTKQRAALLEIQLLFCCATAAKSTQRRPSLDSSVRDLVDTLFELYSIDEYPIRRQRISITALRFAADAEGVLSPGSLKLAARCTIDPEASLGLDAGLAQYRTHLAASHATCVALTESPISTDKLKSALLLWQSIANSGETGDVAAQVDNFETWIAQLQMVSDYFNMQGLSFLRVPTLHLMIKAAEMQQPADFDTMVSTFSALGSQYLHLGYSSNAGLMLAKAQSILNSNDVSVEPVLRWHLAYAEYTLAIGNAEKCGETLETAQDLAAQSPVIADMSRSTASLSSRIRYNQLLAGASHMHSLLSLEIGQSSEALEHAKRCVNLNKRIWASLENRNPLRSSGTSEVTESEVEGLSGGISKMSIASKSTPVVMSMTHESLGGAAFWSFVPSLFRGLTQLSHVFAHQGMFQESVYFADQASKVATAVSSDDFMVQNLSFMSRCYVQGNRSDKALEYLDKAASLVKSLDANMAKANYHQARAELQDFLDEDEDALAEYDQAQAIIDQLMQPGLIGSLDRFQPSEGDLVEKMSDMKLTAAKPRARKAPVQTAAKVAKAKKAPAKTTTKAATRKAPAGKATASKTPMEECPVLSNLHADILRRKASLFLQRERLTEAIALINEAEVMKLGPNSSVQHQSARFRSLMLEAMKEMAGDFTFNTLPESTLSFPALARDRKASEPSGGRPSYLVSPPAPTAGRKVGRGKKTTTEDFVAVLQKARECISEVQRQAVQTSSTSTVQRVCGMLNEVTILLSAAIPKGAKGSLHPLYTAYLTELPKSNATRLEQEAIEVEHKPVTREELLAWPCMSSAEEGETMLTAVDFQNEYINIIPENWTAISLSLNEARDELYITRYHANQSPFILRLPMSRHNSRDMDEEIFGFDEGKAELQEIISLSNFSTQSPPDTTKKGAKTEWWAAREELDARLKDLLVNIENVWLGGFRGVFAEKKGDKTLLARFQKSFQNILDRHLPSRQGKGRKTVKPPQLDARILELFVGLGNPDEGNTDMDEQLMDLVYFVVDILQFSGERNAYDEIDFDSIIVEILDALRSYHTATSATSTTPQHTILILDRNLHAFPWESMPSFQHLSISRLPSMTALRGRLLAARAPPASSGSSTPTDDHSEYCGHHIPLSTVNGASILNPGGDLAHTQKTLSPHLDAMPGTWERSASQAPTEKAFESAVRDRDVLLYFGHGSGAQYVRGRSIKRLYCGTKHAQAQAQKSLATTLLFGCSSAHITENGDFEPSGMLYSYVTAGVPAVLGMLWDVTDKDCDRFAVATLQRWGLFKSEEEPAPVPLPPKTPCKTPSKSRARTPSKARSRSRVRKEESEDVGVMGGRALGLDEAVARSRDACYLRYLNGAAAVVYGIPVFLDRE